MAQHILIIDDDTGLLTTTQSLLERHGYEVSTTPSAFGASNLIRELQPDLVLLDVNMPGLSGEGLAEALARRGHTHRVPILFYSSNDAETLRAAASRLGVAGFICKGDLEELLRKVREHLRPKTPSWAPI